MLRMIEASLLEPSQTMPLCISAFACSSSGSGSHVYPFAIIKLQSKYNTFLSSVCPSSKLLNLGVVLGTPEFVVSTWEEIGRASCRERV